MSKSNTSSWIATPLPSCRRRKSTEDCTSIDAPLASVRVQRASTLPLVAVDASNGAGPDRLGVGPVKEVHSGLNSLLRIEPSVVTALGPRVQSARKPFTRFRQRSRAGAPASVRELLCSDHWEKMRYEADPIAPPYLTAPWVRS